MKRDSAALNQLVEEIAMLLEATVRAEEGIYHLTVPISPEAEGDDDDAEQNDDEPAFLVTVALSTNDDGTTLFATRRLCAYEEELDLEELLRDLGGTIHVQLSIDEDNDLVLGGAAPLGADPEWIADMVGEIAEFAPGIADDAAPVT